VCVNSQIKNGCAIVAMNSEKKKTATPGGKTLTQGRKRVEGRVSAHTRIFFGSHQGVTRTTVNTIEILVPLLSDKPNVPGEMRKGPHQIAVHQPTTTR